jgi:transcriptional regulator with XRE-family HTH domain
MVITMGFRGERLLDLRKTKGFTQDDLADQVGISQRMIGRYESGESDPSADSVIRLANFFGVTADYLLGLTDDPLGRLDEADLSAAERRLIVALRTGALREALDTFTEISRSDDDSAKIGR